RERARRVGRDATIALGAGLGAAFVGALVAGARAAAAQGYWATGYVRIAADGVWERFDPGALVAATVAVVAMAGLRLGGGRAGGALFRPALAVVALVVGLRIAALVDAWRASRGPNVLLI